MEKKKYCFLVAFSLSKNIKDMKHFIFSLSVLESEVAQEIVTGKINKFYDSIGFKKLVIIRVLPGSGKSSYVKLFEVSVPDLFIGLYTVYFNNFIDDPFIVQHVLNKSELNNKIIFLFEYTNLKEIAVFFRFHNILISGGSSTKRHLLSPLHLRLSRFLIVIELNRNFTMENMTKLISNSFHSLEEEYRIGMDLTENSVKETTNVFRQKYLMQIKEKIKIIEKEVEELNKKLEELDIKLNARFYAVAESEEGQAILKNLKSKFGNDPFIYLHFAKKIRELIENQPLITSPSKDKNEWVKDEIKLIKREEREEMNTKEKNNLFKLVNGCKDVGKRYTTIEEDSNDSENILNNKSITVGAKNSQFSSQIGGLSLWESRNSNIKKREFHNSSKILENISDEKFKIVDSAHFSYLQEISKIIRENSENLENAQIQIETSWSSMMKAKLEDPKGLSHRLSKLLLSAKETLNTYCNHYTARKRFPLIYEELNKLDYLMITFALVIAYHTRLGHTAIAMIVGNAIIFDMYKNKYKKMIKLYKKEEINEEDLISYKNFKDSLELNNSKILKLGAFFIDVLCSFPINIFERSLKIEESSYGELAVLIINSDYLDDVKQNIVIPPSSLPMICKPIKWSDHSFGGFLENKYQQIGIITGADHHYHVVENKENLYKTINYLNSIKFGINNSLLNYLNNEGRFLFKDLENLDYGEVLQREITLRVAKAYLNIPFYLNTHADFRGRIYTQSFFISYQGSDLSLALLNLWDGKTLTESGRRYFYIYGANVYNENNISKKSYDERVEWVKTNYNNILKMDPSFIKKAELKFVFTAFCLTMKELDKNKNTLVNLPVFLDATCSGIQHFSALLKDFELAQHVNLKTQNDMDKVEDIYADMVNPINKAINEYGIKNHDFFNLSLVKLSRKLLKLPIMTKLYNSTPFGMVQQLKSNLIKIIEKKEKKIEIKYIVPGKTGSVILNSLELFKIGSIIHEQIFVLYPSLQSIYSYFIDIVKLMIELNIPMVWITPSGLKITQAYSRSKLNKVAINMGGKHKSMVLREWTNVLDKAKQVQAIIPNIIHSLDATHLINLINFADENNFSPIITVHDCFGTHPNKLEKLSFMVKKEFVLLYTQSNFLQDFHDRVIQAVKDNQYIIHIDKNTNEQFIKINLKKHVIPQLPKLGKLDLQNILESKYMIT